MNNTVIPGTYLTRGLVAKRVHKFVSGRYGATPLEIRFHGSRHNGNHKPDSDIDIVCIIPEDSVVLESYEHRAKNDKIAMADHIVEIVLYPAGPLASWLDNGQSEVIWVKQS